MNSGLTQLGKWHSTLFRGEISSSSKTKSQVLTLLTLCLGTSALLAPAQAAFGATTEQIKSEESEHWVCVKEGNRLLCDLEANATEQSRFGALANNSLKSSTANVLPQLLTSSQQDFLANNFLWLSYLLPGGLALGLFMYDKYSGYRLAVLKEQINTLEKLWKQSTQP